MHGGKRGGGVRLLYVGDVLHGGAGGLVEATTPTTLGARRQRAAACRSGLAAVLALAAALYIAVETLLRPGLTAAVADRQLAAAAAALGGGGGLPASTGPGSAVALPEAWPGQGDKRDRRPPWGDDSDDEAFDGGGGGLGGGGAGGQTAQKPVDSAAEEAAWALHDPVERDLPPLGRPYVPGQCDLAAGRWVHDGDRRPLYNGTCLHLRNAWNCRKNSKPGFVDEYAWRWQPDACDLDRINPEKFLTSFRDRNLGFVGDSLNENMVVSLMCTLRTADKLAHKWGKKGAWRGAYFPTYNVTVAYHRAVLLAQYQDWRAQDAQGPLEQLGYLQGVRVDVDQPAADWALITSFYHVFVFNSGHWFSADKFDKQDMPVLFFDGGEPVMPPLDIIRGFALVMKRMVAHIEKTVPSDRIKLWRLQSPRHFEGGEWNTNGTCTDLPLLSKRQVEEWFRPENGGVNRDARELNTIITSALQDTSIRQLDVTGLSEFRADAHPARWMYGKAPGKQDCQHWCLPGVPDTWNDILVAQLLRQRGQHLAAEAAHHQPTNESAALPTQEDE
eukprot:SM000052S17726  [mRNA]  locus=s52:368091:371296:- [translate_table: standard]